jgi:hypothetical protein
MASAPAIRTAVTANMVRPVRRGTIIGKGTGGPPLSDADHFLECEACGGWFDMRDLGAVLDHEEPCPIRWKIRHDEMPSAAALVVAWVDALPRSSAPRSRAGAQGSHQRALHMNAIVSPIPTKAYKPATVTPRQTSAMTLSGWSLICLFGIAPLLGCRPARIDHAGDGKLFRFQV